MFTGIIEEVGKVGNITRSSKGATICIDARYVLEGTSVGDSIAVNGICLTVTDIDSRGFRADVMPETMERTNLGKLRIASPVNLERAMPADGRFGGHIVSGHIDCVAKLRTKTQVDNAFIFEFETPVSALRYVVEKGSVALNGISLTVVAVQDFDRGKDAVGSGTLSVSVIPHTLSETNLEMLERGAEVNLECDMIGKYVERLMGFTGDGETVRMSMLDAGPNLSSDEGTSGGISMTFLAENGF